MLRTEGKLDAYVRQMHSQLDTTTVTATLALMVAEVVAAIDKQRRLIALERLAQRNSTVSLNELHALERVHATLSAALQRESVIVQDGMHEDWGTVVPLRAGRN
jgi:hypothetical protein